MNSNKEVMSRPEKVVYKWDAIDWRKLERSVFKLQKRIYQASKSGDWKRMKRLQKLLLKSKSAKLLAVRRVTQINKGKKTAGVDGVKSLSPTQRLKLAEELNLNEKSKPVRRIWIPKPGKSEKRPLGIHTMSDRAKQALVKLTLEPEWEAKSAPNTYGFRPARSCHDAIEAIYIAINQKNAYVLDADIKGCFDNIDHVALLKKINTFPRLRRVIKGWLRNGIMEGEVFQKMVAGTPQGGVISPLLANIALHGLEYELKEALLKDLCQYAKQKMGYLVGKERAKRYISIVFYADDFVVIHESKEIILKAKEYIERWLGRIGLKLNPTKTRVTHTLQSTDGNEPGFNFLGFSIRQYPTKTCDRGYKTLTKPSLENQKKHRRIIDERLDRMTACTQDEVIKALNPVIRGWSNYFRTGVSSRIFSKMDDYVFQKLWKWVRWKHPKKGLRWIKRKYFPLRGNRQWRFASGSNLIRRHTETHIKRHVKVQSIRTPYDGDLQYWSKRFKKRNFSINDLAERCI